MCQTMDRTGVVTRQEEVDVIFSVNRGPIDTKKLLNSLAIPVLLVIVLSLTYNDNLCADLLLFLSIMFFCTLHEFGKLSS